MKKKYIFYGLLMLCMFFTISTTNVKAEESSTVTLDLTNGPIDITPTGYSQDSENEVPFTGAYIITGRLITDTPLDIKNNSGSTVTFDITLDNAEIIAGPWCTAVRIEGNSPIILNITNKGKSTIQGYNHSALKLNCTSDVTIDIKNEENSSLALERSYYTDGDPIIFSNSTYNGGVISVSVDGKELSCKDTSSEHEYLPSWMYFSPTMKTSEFLNNIRGISFALKCPTCNAIKAKTSDFTTELNVSKHYENGTGRYVAIIDGVKYYSNEITLVATPHSLVNHPAKDATCTDAGNISYWTCKDCEKVFSDENGTVEITLNDIKIVAKGHSYKDGKCAVCGVADPNYVKPDTTIAPITGDQSHTSMWIALLVISCVGMATISYYRYNRKVRE